MKRFKDVLYFADGVTEPCSALRRAVTLAESNDARLTVLDVIPESPARVEVEARLSVDIQRLMREERQDQLDALIAPFGDRSVQIGRRVATGIPFVEVIREVIGQGRDMVIKSARPPDGFVPRTLGSTDLHLLRKCPCPIWIERANAPERYRTVLAAVDPSEESEEESARLIMDLATSLARSDDARLAVVHTWTLEGEEVLRSDRLSLSDTELAELLAEVREHQRERLDAVLSAYHLSSDDGRVYLAKGEPAPVIRQLSMELGADLIVMGTLGSCGVPGVFIGDTAEDLLHMTQASVLAIKPYDFESPVTLAPS